MMATITRPIHAPLNVTFTPKARVILWGYRLAAFMGRAINQDQAAANIVRAMRFEVR